MKIKFTKMHGIGNDYIYVNCFDQTVPDPEGLSIKWSHRNFGIGGDGLVLIMPSDKADCRMRMFNADGSEGKMCGNAVRCIGKYVYDNNIIRKDEISIETLSGIKVLKMQVEDGVATGARVDMGAPVLEPANIPVIWNKPSFVDEELSVNDKIYHVTCVSMGNPHAVIFTMGIDRLKLEEIGPMFEHDQHFPERVNTEFVEIAGKNILKMRVWERGSGETLACGTGACAVVVAAVLNNIVKRNEDVTVMLKGGNLSIRWDDDGKVYMTGAAEKAFDGEIEI